MSGARRLTRGDARAASRWRGRARQPSAPGATERLHLRGQLPRVAVLRRRLAVEARACRRETQLRAASFRVPGPFQLEAAIQSAHCQRLFSGHTPWKAIEFLYTTLNATWPTIASAVAHAAVLVELERGADAEAVLGRIDRARVADYAPYWVVLSHARRLGGDQAGAREAMTKAITLTRSPRLRAYLEQTLARRFGPAAL
jgi:predicted RNA polymerase sigma factor